MVSRKATQNAQLVDGRQQQKESEGIMGTDSGWKKIETSSSTKCRRSDQAFPSLAQTHEPVQPFNTAGW